MTTYSSVYVYGILVGINIYVSDVFGNLMLTAASFTVMELYRSV